MNVFLLNPDKDFNLQQELVWNSGDLKQDLGLPTLFEAMAGGSAFFREISEKVILCRDIPGKNTILYRQEIINDCIKNQAVIRELYELASETIENEKNNHWGIFRNYPNSVLFRSVEVFGMFIRMLKRIKKITDENSDKFNSSGFKRFFSMIQDELDERYFEELEQHLELLRFSDGVLMSVKLGSGNKGSNYVLRKLEPLNFTWWQRIIRFLFRNNPADGQNAIRKDKNGIPASYTFFISSRDDSGIRSLRELKDEGINLVANSLAQSDEHILNFFKNLRTELAFYTGCINLHEKLTSLYQPVCFPDVAEGDTYHRQFKGLYDACLTLTTRKEVTGNDCNAIGKKLIIITGANQGGKSTFLRSLGLAQLMMQCGMFVPAVAFKSSLCGSLITHFRREEDSGMKSGKLDEELARMNQIVEKLTRDTFLLINESFAATNEREGSEIASQIVCALVEYHITIAYVTHLYEFARNFFNQKLNHALFLRAERQMDGVRTFKISEGEPLQTSFGNDLYKEVFDEKPEVVDFKNNFHE